MICQGNIYILSMILHNKIICNMYIAEIRRMMKTRQYPIRAVSKETGLSIPGRTKRGRIYSDEAIERLELLRRVTELGYSIGQIAKWNNEQNPSVLVKRLRSF
jgi:DNA-binding transcriptional MerR regulator